MNEVFVLSLEKGRGINIISLTPSQRSVEGDGGRLVAI
jgi:hypothetical protein